MNDHRRYVSIVMLTIIQYIYYPIQTEYTTSFNVIN